MCTLTLSSNFIFCRIFITADLVVGVGGGGGGGGSEVGRLR